MDITSALREVEARISSTSRGEGENDGILNKALESIINSWLGRNHTSSEAVSTSHGRSQAEEEAEADYALSVMLNLSKLSDPRFQTYFSVLQGMGVSIEDAHRRTLAYRSLLAFKHELFTGNPQNTDDCEVKFSNKHFRICVEDRELPQVFILLFQSALISPAHCVKIVEHDFLTISGECFLEVHVRDRGVFDLQLCIKPGIIEDPAFLVPMISSMRMLSRSVVEEEAVAVPSDSAVKMLLMAKVSGTILERAIAKGALEVFVPSQFTASLLGVRLTSLNILAWWVDSLHNCSLCGNRHLRVVHSTNMNADQNPRILLLGNSSLMYALSLYAAWLLLDRQSTDAKEERTRKACEVLHWLCSYPEKLRGEEYKNREVIVDCFCRLCGVRGRDGDKDGDSTCISSGMKRKAEGSLEGDTITKDPLLPPIGACILINIAAAALGMLPWGPGCELSTPPVKRPDVLETNASRACTKALSLHMRQCLDEKDSPLAQLLVEILKCSVDQRTDAVRQAGERMLSLAKSL